MLLRNNKNGSRERIVVIINKLLKSQYSINVFHIMTHNSDFLITSNSLNMNLLCDDNFDFIYTVCKLLAERTGMRCLDTSRREASSFTQKSQNFVFSFVSNLFASFISHLLQCVNYVQFCSWTWFQIPLNCFLSQPNFPRVFQRILLHFKHKTPWLWILLIQLSLKGLVLRTSMYQTQQIRNYGSVPAFRSHTVTPSLPQRIPVPVTEGSFPSFSIKVCRTLFNLSTGKTKLLSLAQCLVLPLFQQNVLSVSVSKSYFLFFLQNLWLPIL